MKKLQLHHRAARAIYAAPLALLLTACGGKTTINVNDYFTTELKGYNGGGSVSAELDTASLVADYSDAFGLTDSDSVLMFNSIIANVNEHLTGDFDNNEMLGNGDQISFIWDKSGIDTLEQDYNIKLNVEDVIMDVADLPDLQEFNPFDYVIVTHEKSENTGLISTTVSLSDDFPIPHDELYAVIQSGDHHIEGGTFTVTIEIMGQQGLQYPNGVTVFEQYCLDNGYTPVEIEKEYQVPNKVD